MSTLSTPSREEGHSGPCLSVSRQLALVLRQPPLLANLVLIRKLPQQRTSSKALNAFSAAFSSSSRSSGASSSRFMLAEIRGASLVLHPVSAHLTVCMPPSLKIQRLDAVSAQLHELEQILDTDTIKASADHEEIIVINLKNLRVKPNDNNAIAVEITRSQEHDKDSNSHDTHHSREPQAPPPPSSSSRWTSRKTNNMKLSTALSGFVRGRSGRMKNNINASLSSARFLSSRKKAQQNPPSQSASSSSRSSSRTGVRLSISHGAGDREHRAEEESSRATQTQTYSNANSSRSSSSKAAAATAASWSSSCSSSSELVELRFSSNAVMTRWAQMLVGAATQRKARLSDFNIVRMIGKGAGGQVFHVHDTKTGEQLALKVMDKTCIANSSDSYRRAVDERLLMELTCNHPFILRLRHAFQTELRLYLVTDFCEAGDLFDCIRRRRKPFPIRVARRIAAQIVLALEYIHSLGAVHRDLKLENILIDSTGHVRVADFGASKMLRQLRIAAPASTPSSPASSSAARGANSKEEEQERVFVARTRSFCGTREYIAPEMIQGHPYGRSVDVWAFGVVLYELITGRSPFFSANRDEIYRKIESAPLRIPPFVDDVTADLITRLLDRNVTTRIGCGDCGMEQVREHPFFEGFKWEELLMKVPHEDDLDAAFVARDGDAQAGKNRNDETGVEYGAEDDFDDEDDEKVEEELPRELLVDLEEERREEEGAYVERRRGETWDSFGLKKNKSSVTPKRLTTPKRVSTGSGSMIAGYGYTHDHLRMGSDGVWSSMTPKTDDNSNNNIVLRTFSGSSRWHASGDSASGLGAL
eukprot:CAMPEP_0185850428 /NCGR_PEP_ID=MMETSP1354-20130828/4568_1 /TAXON_ID=708628 /ORGANISM="Erythrolobus madagascarensis, Strain CCMP3276" /LENGTH=815 /DNA_ID=CAMNT_0028551101 /DNA_START=175 /DNA_END=2622 /DNA_ORIENTATION=+